MERLLKKAELRGVASTQRRPWYQSDSFTDPAIFLAPQV
jgi:hypothetical protein